MSSVADEISAILALHRKTPGCPTTPRSRLMERALNRIQELEQAQATAPASETMLDRIALPFLWATGLHEVAADPHIMQRAFDVAARYVAERGAQPSVPAADTPETDVRKIRLGVVPRADGMGPEVYAESVAEVEAILRRQVEIIEELEGRLAALKRPLDAPAEVTRAQAGKALAEIDAAGLREKLANVQSDHANLLLSYGELHKRSLALLMDVKDDRESGDHGPLGPSDWPAYDELYALIVESEGL